jgi:hypothetical protein
MTNKIKSLVSSILTHSLDTTLIPLSIIKPHVSDNLRLTLQSADYQLKYTPTGTVLNIKIPVLSHENSGVFSIFVSSLGRYVFGSEISYNKAPPRLPGLGC